MSAEVIVDPVLLDFSKTCRLCLQQTTELMPLFAENDYSGSPDSSLPSKIMACVSIEVSNESGNIPRQVCCKCVQQIDNWVKFKELCDSANALLHQCLANLQSSDETEKAIIEGDCCINEQGSERKAKEEEGEHKVEVNNSKSYILIIKGEDLNERNNKVDDNHIKSDIKMENSAKNDLTEEIRTEFSEENKKKYFNTVETKTPCDTVNDIKQQKISKWKFKYDRYQKKKYKCGLKMCDKFFSRFCDLISHDRSDHEDVTMDKACEICGKMFVNDERIVIHLSIYHGEKKFTCDICDGKFLSKVSLRSHMKKHSGQWVCTDCGSSVSSNMALLEHRRKHSGEKPFVCDTCGRSFVTKTSLNSHKQSHTKELLFKCSLCGYAALNHSSMRVHKATHSLKKDCICETCGKMFKLQTRLQEHRKTHDPVKRYVCDVCKMSFTGKYRLTLHSRVHTGERPYVCDTCNKQFARQDALKEHIRTHTGEKKYTCQHCSKQFSFLKSFKNHKCSVTNNVYNYTSKNGIRPPPVANGIVSDNTSGKQIRMETTSTSTSSVPAEVNRCLYETS